MVDESFLVGPLECDVLSYGLLGLSFLRVDFR
jgi:hypothetical protein